MSEIKGQLLGVLLVVAIFGAIGFTLYSAFTSAASKVAGSFDKFDPTQEPSKASTQVSTATEIGSLTF